MNSLDPRLLAAVADTFGIPAVELVPGAELDADLQLDSLSIAELQVVLEDALEVRLTVENPSAVRTLADLQVVVDQALLRAEPLMPALQLREDA